MTETTGIPQLIDLTHVADLMLSGKYLLMAFFLALILTAIYGAVLALLSRSDRLPDAALEGWARDYGRGLKFLQHLALSSWLAVVTFVIASTLANRYHHWEQQQIQQTAQTVEGERLEQQTPSVRWFTKRTRSETRYIDGKPTQVTLQEDLSHALNLAASDVQVGLEQFTQDSESGRLGYKVSFQGVYTVRNTLPEAHTFFFDAYLPRYYSLLSGYKVEREGITLNSGEQSNRSFKFELAPGESTRITLRYEAQGATRWVYTADQSVLSNFSLRLKAMFNGAEFASGIPPTRTEANPQGPGTTFIWEFKDNVSVQHPFGVFTAARSPVLHTGVMPRLLLLAPALLLAWLLVLYLSVPLKPLQVIGSGGLFLAALLALTYFSRLIDPRLAWLLLSAFIAAIVWFQHRGHRWQALLGTVSALILPVMAMLVPYTGLTLGLAALLSILWLTVQQNREEVGSRS